MSKRSDALADRLEQGARALASLASSLTDAEWQTRIPKDGRKIGVVVHHVASMYPLEIQLAQVLASGKPVTGVTWDVSTRSTPGTRRSNDAVTKEAALDLLQRNSTAAAAAIRALSDERARQRGRAVAQRRCPAHVPVHARGSRGAAQLSSLRAHSMGVAAVDPARPPGQLSRW